MTEKYVRNMFVRSGKLDNHSYLINGRQCFEVNEIGLFIWNCFNSPTSIDDVQEEVFSNYAGRNNDRMKKEICDFIRLLIDYDLIAKVTT